MALEAALPEIEMQCDVGEVDLPTIYRLLTKDWVENALRAKYPGVVLRDMAITRMTAGNSTKVWLSLEYDPSGPDHDLPPTMVFKAGFNRHDPIMLFTYMAEMLTYRDVLPKFPLTSPVCYYAGEGPEGLAAAILMEDLCVRNLRFCHATKPLNKEEATAFVGAIARRHAQSWNHPALTDGSWSWPKENIEIQSHLGDYFSMLFSDEQWSRFVKMPRCAAISNRFHDRDKIQNALAEVARLNTKRPQIVMIGDTHMGNLYIEEDGTPGFLDFLSRIDCWANEFAYFIAGALDMVDRRAWERGLLQHYLDTLQGNGVTPPSFDEAWQAYGENLMNPLMTWITNGEQFQTETVNASNSGRTAAAALDHGTLDKLLS